MSVECVFPKALSQGVVSCGRCIACRVKAGRKWTGRLLLESFQSPFNWFATLTYAPGSLPVTADGRMTLQPQHVVQLQKRLQKRLGRCPRFFLVGEYGELGGRPHYHACYFGVEENMSQILNDEWAAHHGFVSVSFLNLARMKYVVGYTTKKLIGADLDAKGPVAILRRSSRGPALGDAYLMAKIAPYYSTAAGRAAIRAYGDVGASFRFDGQSWALSNRHVRMLRAAAGLPVLKRDVVAATGVAPEPEAFPSEEELKRREAKIAEWKARQSYKLASQRKWRV